MTSTRPHQFLYRGNAIAAPPLAAGLYIVSTPIGNLADITLRALETLAASSVIACEDTRTTSVLLKKYGIDRPKIAYNEHNAASRGPDLLRQIGQGASVALVSDAGTPLISDPGFRLVQEACRLEYLVTPLPGASAALAALVASGLATGDFRFCGFLPPRQGARQQRLSELAGADCTLVFYESPKRIAACLSDMVQLFGAGRNAVVAREMTKLHETFYRGSLQSLSDQLEAMDRVRGEIAIVVEAAPSAELTLEQIADLLRQSLSTMKTKQAASHVAQLSGRSRQEIYRLALEIKDET